VPGALWWAHIRAARSDSALSIATLLSMDPDCPPEWFAALANDSALVEHLACNPGFPGHLLERIVRPGMSSGVLCHIAVRPDCPADLLHRIATSTPVKTGATQAAALNPNCSEETLRRLVRLDPTYVLANPSCPPDILEEWWRDTRFKPAIASNPNLPAGLRRKVERCVRKNVVVEHAQNPGARPAWLYWLVGNGSYFDEVYPNPAIPPRMYELAAEVLDGLDTYVIACLAENPNCPAWLLEMVAERPEDTLRVAVARHRSTPVATLGRLVDENDPQVVEAAAANPAADSAVLEKVMQTGRPMAQFNAVWHTNISWHSLEQAELRMLRNSNTRTRSLPTLEASQLPYVQSMSSDWEGTLGELLHAAQLLAN